MIKYKIVTDGKYFFILNASESGMRHWEMLSEIPFESKDAAISYLNLHKEIYIKAEFEIDSFTTVHVE